MTFNRALMLATLVAACSMQARAQKGASPSSASPPAPTANIAATSGGGAGSATLQPRQVIPKPARAVKLTPDSQLVVKFRDEVRARPNQDKSVRLQASAPATTDLGQVVARHGLRFEPLAPNVPQSKLDEITTRAELYSGIAQPDLGGMMVVRGPGGSIEAAANELLALDCVEFVHFVNTTPGQLIPAEPKAVHAHARMTAAAPAQMTTSAPSTAAGLGIIGACCLPTGGCQDLVTLDQCDALLGIFFAQQDCADITCPEAQPCCTYVGPDGCDTLFPTVCISIGGVVRGESGDDCSTEQCQFDCGEVDAPSCFVPHAIPACNDEDCCELVGAFRPFCITEENPPPDGGPGGWDETCTILAHYLCSSPEADSCLTGGLNETCFISHPHAGCDQQVCCETVCNSLGFSYCCDFVWDEGCAFAALTLCPTFVGAQTPDLAAFQGYLRPSPYLAQVDGVPPTIEIPSLFIRPQVAYLQPLWGQDGDGYDLFAEGPFTVPPSPPVRLRDNPAMPAPQRYAGLYGLGRELKEKYGIGAVNGARGAGVKVGVLWYSYYQFHEDLNVVPEPGQTMIVIPDITLPDWGTAMLGIINAKDNAFGTVGIAPDSKSYFFPLTSVEEGPRESAAYFSAYSTLGPGDVLCIANFTPVVNNNNADPFRHVLITLGVNLGITCVVGAGHWYPCTNLDDLDDQGDSGAIVVGGGTPGFPHCRELESNYYRTAAFTDSSHIHCQAWGARVATTGFGDLFQTPDGNPNRAYTANFSYTQAASAQIAGLVACMQGLAKQFYGIPLAPRQMQFLFGRDTWFDQCALPPADLPGFPDEVACGVDSNPEFEGNRIGDYILPRALASLMLTEELSGFGGLNMVRDVYVLRGNHIFGNAFSIRNSDNSYYLVQSLFTNRDHVVNLNSTSAEANFVASLAKYSATGYTTDVMVRAQAPVGDGTAQPILVRGEISHSDQVGLVFFELFDWILNRWVFVGFNNIPPTPVGGEVIFIHGVPDGQRFIHPNSRNVYLRAYLLSSGGAKPSTPNMGGSATPGSTIRFDLLEVLVGAGGVVPLP